MANAYVPGGAYVEGAAAQEENMFRRTDCHFHIRRDGYMYVFRPVVAEAEFVTRSDERWRDLAYRAWRKNALKEFVTFAFDENHRLIGLVAQPVATLDHEEFRFYIEALAKECDRFEYVLRGEDSL